MSKHLEGNHRKKLESKTYFCLMLKNILAVGLGLVLAFVVIVVIEGINGYLFPLPEHINYKDTAAMAEYISNLPVAALCIVIFAHAAGAIAASWVIVKRAVDFQMMYALIAGMIITVASVANWMSIAHPEWFKVVDTAVIVPAAWLGAKLFGVKRA